jgi:hypothetical protein
MNFYNKVLDKKGLKRIVSWFIENYGPTRTSLLLDEFKYIGFHYAGKAGLSLGFDDLRIPPTKKNLLAAAQQQVQSCEKTYLMGRITAFERYQKLIDIWTTTSEKLKDEVIQNFEKIQGGPLASPLYMMAFSGARGNISQVRQLVGMRGLMSDSGGGIIDFPIRSNFREGLTVTEYVISCYGARKGLIDTALRTADSGYLTRRLVDVAHGIIIREIDCGTIESISMKISDTQNLLGRVLAETVRSDFETQNELPEVKLGGRENQSIKAIERQASVPHLGTPPRVIWRNQEISVSIILELKNLKGPKASVQVRSPLTCLSQSVCQLCYGWNLAQGRLVSLGEAVGILAAQSIGEPGTQLTMRTFHTGGIFSTEVEDKLYSPQDGSISLNSKMGDTPQFSELSGNSRVFRGCKIRSVHGQTAFFFFDPIQLKIKTHGGKEGKNPRLSDITTLDTKSLNHEEFQKHLSQSQAEKESILELPAQSILFISPGNKIAKNTLFAEISRIKQPTGDTPQLYDKNSGGAEGENTRLRSSTSPMKGEGMGDNNTIEKTKSLSSLGVNPPAPLAHKKVFSEIEGEVVEKMFPNFIQKTRVAGGTPRSSPPTFPTDTSTHVPSSRKLVVGASKGTSVGEVSPLKRGVPPRSYSSETKKQKMIIKSRIVLAGEPFVFKRKQSLRAGGGGRPSFAEEGNPLPLPQKSEIQASPPRIENTMPVRQLPFRTGDIVFWQGKRKFNTFQVQELQGMKGISPPHLCRPTLEIRRIENNVGGELRSGIGFSIGQNCVGSQIEKPMDPRSTPAPGSVFGFMGRGVPRYPLTSLSSPLSAELKSKNMDTVKSGRFISTEGQKTTKKLTYSGLVLQFKHQKERKYISLPSGASEAHRFLDSTADVPTNPKTHSFVGGTPPTTRETFVAKKQNIGNIFQPYVSWGPTPEIGTPGLILDSNCTFAGLNIPTQIIRKRNKKVILRHVQIHLGADTQATSLQVGGTPAGTHESFSPTEQKNKVFTSSSAALPHYVKQRDVVFQLVLPISQSSSSSDIVQGLPKIEQLFEARTKIVEPQGTRESFQFGSPSGGGTPPVPNKTELNFGQSAEKTNSQSFNPYSESKATLRSLQKRLIQEIQSVYNSQGVDIADKHLEIIVRQMTSRIRVLEKGNTPFFPDDIVSGVLLNPPHKTPRGVQEDRGDILPDTETSSVLETSPVYEWVLMGITKVALLATTESYISAASFQETKRVLMNSALQNRVDFFEGLKENVIVGRMIPAGTGYSEFI